MIVSATRAVTAMTVAALALMGAGSFAGQAPTNPTPQQAEFFENQVRPLLVSKCYSCHGPAMQSGSLRLDSLDAILKGGASGPAIVPGSPEKSALIRAVHYDGSLKMPPTGKLKPAEIAALTEWVQTGAKWPGAKPVTAAANGEFTITELQRSFWSFKPVYIPPLPAVHNAAWVRNPVDRFILAKLESKGLKPAPAADRRSLIRRVTFDLIGLPPTPAEVDNFVHDTSPSAYAKVVDRLLADPRYGERWGRHWLDVARYADTKGYVFVDDAVLHNAYTYRDYVIRSFNEDLPYNQFIIEQLAADKLKLGDDKRPLAALGFLTVGRHFLNDPVLINDDRIDATCRGMMGFTVECARCHNHKFDPISQKDYYALYGVFASCEVQNPPAAISPRAISEPYEAQLAKIRTTEQQRNDLIRTQVNVLRKTVASVPQTVSERVKTTLQAIREEALPNEGELAKLSPSFDAQARTTIKDLADTAKQLKATMPPAPELAMSVVDTPKPFEPYVFLRGNPGNRGDSVKRRFIQLLSGPDEQPFADGGRLELAKDIASPTNPLTSRVIVNRLWLYHFGYGIVRTPSDFGARGERPSHPELLDWLAGNFVADGGTPNACNWSIKKMQRIMVLSNAYQQSSNTTAHDDAVDPENRLLAHQNRQRLDLEAMRDSLLFVGGQLDTKLGGPAVEITTPPYSHRRTVYGYIDRQNLQGFYRTFDFASPDATSAQRYHTTVPQQSLFMMNSPFVVQEAEAVDKRAETLGGDAENARIRTLYRLLFDRVPTAEETAIATSYLRLPASPLPPSPWQYGYGGYDAGAGKVTFTKLPYFGSNTWRGGAAMPDAVLSYLSLTANGGHPGNDANHAAIRRWTSPIDGSVSIRGALIHPSAEGDGVQARIVSSRSGEVGRWVAAHGQADTSVAQIEVKRGETLDFMVDCRTGPGFDSFQWAPVITTLPAAGVSQVSARAAATWSAEADFSGPEKPTGSELSAWDRYVQALLMTNEFAFVD